jgi:hypothetical protein
MKKKEKMLNIIKSKLNITHKKKPKNKENITLDYKDFVPVVRNWKSSIYAYNKNTLSLIPFASNFAMKLIRGYFNSYSLKLEKKLRKERLRRRLRKLSTNKIFISNGEFKHTNDKVVITMFVYNRQRFNYLYKIKNRYTRLFVKSRFLNKLNLIKNVGLNILNQQQERNKILIKVLPSYKSKLLKTQHLYYKKFIKKALKRLKYYMFFKQLLYINQNKFNFSYLQGLMSLIKKIYNKNIEFNIINLKYFYFNSDIFSQPLVLKLRRKRKLLRYLKACVRKAKIKNIRLNEKSKYFFDIENLFNLTNDVTSNLLYKLFVHNKTKSNFLKKVIFNNIRYKRVSGVRLEAAGRLTRRYTASRSQHKVRYKGDLENYFSSVKGYSSLLLRGNDKPNLECTKLNSKSRIGSFGVKGWVSGT